MILILTLTQFALSVGVIGEGDRHGLKLKIGVIKWGTQQVVSHPCDRIKTTIIHLISVLFSKHLFFPGTSIKVIHLISVLFSKHLFSQAQALKSHKESGEHKQKIILYINVKGIRIMDERTLVN